MCWFIAFLLLVAVIPITLLADTIEVLPDDQGLLHLIPAAELRPILISNCAPPNELPVPCPGDHFYPKVDADLASYISQMSGIYRAAYYDFFSGETNVIPQQPDVDWWEDYLPQVSGDKIAFWRMQGAGATISEAILVYDITNGTTTEVQRIGPATGYQGGVYFPAIGANTVVYEDRRTYPGELWVANLANPGAGPIQLSHNDETADKRFDEWPSVSPDGRVVVWQSCVPLSPGNCDIWKATLSAGTWTSTAVTTDEHVEEYPKTDGTLIVYTKRPPGGDYGVFNQQDICWQPVAGGTEKCLALEGYQTWPSVRGGLIAFSGAPRSESDTELELYVYHVDTNRLFQITSTQGASDELADLTVLPDGHFRVVFNTGPPTFPHYDRDVYGVTFTLPEVDAFTFGGFLAPVDPFPTFNSMKAGAAVAVKFSLGGFRGLDIFASGYPTSSSTACSGSSMEDPIEQTVTAGNSGLQYDAATDQYSYVWKTQKAWAGTCRQLRMQFTDGTVAYANFLFR